MFPSGIMPKSVKCRAKIADTQWRLCMWNYRLSVCLYLVTFKSRKLYPELEKEGKFLGDIVTECSLRQDGEQLVRIPCRRGLPLAVLNIRTKREISLWHRYSMQSLGQDGQQLVRIPCRRVILTVVDCFWIKVQKQRKVIRGPLDIWRVVTLPRPRFDRLVKTVRGGTLSQ